MGVTVHFEGQLKGEEEYDRLISAVRGIAASEKWLTETIEATEKTLLRVRDEQDWDYTGPVKGIIVYLHEDCDPVMFEFDCNLYVQEFTKTQFAGVESHIKVTELLRSVQPFFVNLKVEDEGEYWETGDAEILAKHIETCDEMIQEQLKKHPQAQFKVKDADGKIIDLIK